MIDGLVTAIRRANGSLRGVALAAQLERFRGVQTLSGKVSFSPQLHTVFGRTYRVMRIQNNQVRVRRARCKREGRGADLASRR